MSLETQAAFARRIGKDRSHVTRLKQAGRLVMREGRIVVEDSLKLLADTESPLPRDEANRARLAAERATEIEDRMDLTLAEAGRQHKIAQAQKMAHEAEIAGLERARLEGKLVAVEDVLAAGADISAAVAEALEGLPDRYAPELAGARDTAQVHALLAEAIEQVLGDLSRALGALADRLGRA
jgi:phage terminase Nu1 subunit (DNA packaging protein)